MTKSRIRIVDLSFLLLVTAITAGFFTVLRPFVLDAFIAAVLAVSFYRPYRGLLKRFGGRRAPAALLVVLLAILVVAIPIGLVGLIVVTEATDAYGRLMELVPQFVESAKQYDILANLAQLPIVGEYFAGVPDIDVPAMLRNVASTAGEALFGAAQSSVAGVGSFLFSVAITLLLFIYLILDGDRLVAWVRDALPIANGDIDEITGEAVQTIGATLRSTLIIGLIEGTFGGVLFAVFGLRSAFLWGVIIIVISVIPLIGANLVLIPAAVVVAASGRVGVGVLMGALSIGGVLVTQNVIKPKLLGDRSGLHPAMALISTLGGIAWLGIVGVLVGPVLAALFIVIWRQFGRRFSWEMSRKNGAGGTVEGDSRDGGLPADASEDEADEPEGAQEATEA